MQQVLITTWEKKTAFDFSGEPLFTVLIKIARKTAMEACIRNTSSNGKIFPANITVHSNETSNLFPKQSGTITNTEVTTKEALDLVYFKGYSFSDAAMVLNVPLSSFKEKVKMAIAQLREAQ